MSAYRLSPPTPGDESLLSKPRLITSLLPLLSTETPLDPTPRKFGPGSATGPAFVTPAPQDFGTRESGVDTPPAKNCPFLWEVAIGMLLASCCCCCCRVDTIREGDLRLLHVIKKRLCSSTALTSQLFCICGARLGFKSHHHQLESALYFRTKP